MDQPVRPSRSLKGRVAIVTGAGAAGDGIGNGRAAAILLAEDGATVVCVDMAKDPVARTVEMIEKDGKGVTVAALADVTKEEDCKRVVDMALERYGRVDILVNNVGVSGPKGTAVEVDMVEWARGMEVNVASMVTMAKFAIPAMLRNEGDGYWKGSIVNLGSVAGLIGGTPNLLYPTTKGAVINMTRAMAAHHGKDGIRVNCVCPGMYGEFCRELVADESEGMVYTPMMYGKEGGMSQEVRENRRKRSLLGTEGSGKLSL
jgi:NAD(P)-dependent dehydrogenase (short-subunit alcohol dehydrogenase family)